MNKKQKGVLYFFVRNVLSSRIGILRRGGGPLVFLKVFRIKNIIHKGGGGYHDLLSENKQKYVEETFCCFRQFAHVL